MNKNTKIWLNYSIGAVISIALLAGIYLQVKHQLQTIDPASILHADKTGLLILGLCMMPLNLGTEIIKWKILGNAAQPMSYAEAIKSYLAGVSISLITPNRLGEYPGRLLYLKRKNTVRLISISVLGVFAQSLTLFIFGNMGLAFYSIRMNASWMYSLLAAGVIITAFLGLLYFSFEKWIRYFEGIPRLRRFLTYGELMKKFTLREETIVLLLSIFRFALFTAQYFILLRWMNVNISFAEGFFTGALFFGVIGVIPSIALAELGVRGQVSIFLFNNFTHLTQNTIGVLGATFTLWFINLVVPALIGSVLLLKMKLLR